MTNSDADGARGRFSIGRVFSRGFGTIGANPAKAVAMAILVAGVPIIAYHYLYQWLFQWLYQGLFQWEISSPADRLMALKIAVWLISLIISSVLGALAEGGFVPLVIARDAGEQPSFGQALRSAARAAPLLIALGLIMGIALVLGMVALAVPGIMLLIIWTVAPAALVNERIGILAALGRSRMLTKGARWAILGIVLIILFVAGAVQAVTGAVSGLARISGTELIVVEGIIGIVMRLFSGPIHASIYVELRNWKEGAPTDALAEIFA
jgi:hypothetical protein